MFFKWISQKKIRKKFNYNILHNNNIDHIIGYKFKYVLN